MTSDRDPDARDGATPDDALPADPRGLLELIERETRQVQDAARRAVPWFYFSWGITWLVGYLLLWSAAPGTTSPVTVPPTVAGVAFAVGVAGSIAVSAIVGARMGRGIRGRSAFVGTVYGLSWTVLSGGVAALGFALLRGGMPGELAAVYFPSAFALVISALYLAGAMLWRSADQLVIAIVMAVAAAASPFFGFPLHYLVMALVAGGALVVGGVVSLAAMRSGR